MKSEQSGKCFIFKGLDAVRNYGQFRGLVVRETQSSIQDSSHKLLADCIYEHGLARSQNGPFEIQRDRILHRCNGRETVEYIFKGIREDPQQIKSLKGIRGTLFEEAETASAESIEMLEPTVLREEGSFLWYVWNPKLVTSPIYKHLMLGSPPPNTIHIHTSYLDNPWLSKTMKGQAQHMLEKDPKRYAHVWLGKALADIEGAIYTEEMKSIDEQLRICHVPYNRLFPVHTAWDLGFGDPTVIWFVQAYEGWLNFIDYHETTQSHIADDIVTLQQRNYVYGVHYLPHDGTDSIIHHKKIGLIADKSKGIPQIMRAAGLRVETANKLLKHETLNQSRLLFPQCRFDAEKCATGINHLRMYKWDKEPGESGAKKPEHDDACHAPEAFQVATLMINPGGPMAEVPITLPMPTGAGTLDGWMG